MTLNRWTAAGVSILIAATVLCSQHGRAQESRKIDVEPSPFGLFSPPDCDSSITINAAFAPDGRTVFFSKSHAAWEGLTIFEAHKEHDRWSEPEVAWFSGQFRDTDPAVTPDGKNIIYASMRDASGKPAKTYSLFRASLQPGRPPEPLGPEINNGGSNLYPSVASDGTLYFIRNSGKTARIYKAKVVDGAYGSPQPISLPGDSDAVFDSDPTIAPDQSFLVFVSNRPDSLGSNDLYVSFRSGEEWCTPIHLEAPINSAAPEIATGLSVDARTLYFASSRASMKQPRETRADAAAFRTEGKQYENGNMRTYQVELGSWINEHRPGALGCTRR